MRRCLPVPVPLELLGAVAPLRALRHNLDHQIGRSPHLVADDREPFGGHEQHVGLQDECAFSIQNNVHWRNRHPAEHERLGMVSHQPGDPEGNGLV